MIKKQLSVDLWINEMEVTIVLSSSALSSILCYSL